VTSSDGQIPVDDDMEIGVVPEPNLSHKAFFQTDYTRNSGCSFLYMLFDFWRRKCIEEF
jgi:hypothetical protein